MAISSQTASELLTVSSAARFLGVHPNTVRSWTEQGRLSCVRINGRGDRRYSTAELRSFLDRRRPAQAVAQRPPFTVAPAELLRRVLGLVDGSPDRADLLASLGELLVDAGYQGVGFVSGNGPARTLAGQLTLQPGLIGQATGEAAPLVVEDFPEPETTCVIVPLPLRGDAEAVLQLCRPNAWHMTDEQETELLSLLATALRAGMGSRADVDALNAQLRRLEMLHDVGSEIASQLDLGGILNRLLDHAMHIFEAEHAAVLRRLPSGRFTVDQARNLPAEFRQAMENAPELPLTQRAFEEGRVVSDHPADRPATPLQAVVLAAGINTVTAAPLVSEGELLGTLVLYHDERYAWRPDDLALLEQFARMGGMAIKNARDYEQMAARAAQLHSIHQLGVRLTRLSSVSDIGQAICAELNQLINYHNVRVYRIEGEFVVPVAWRGEIGEYTTEDSDQLTIRVGQGITGWVAKNGVAQYLPDAAHDSRAETIPGTDDDLDESLLVAPMLYENEVIGVIVLAKLGLHQFTPDDLRLLEIYASIAAQAMASADASEVLREQSAALARQLQGQQELMRLTRTILGTLDIQELFDAIATSLRSLIEVDNMSVDIHDRAAGMVRPIYAQGPHAAEYMLAALPDTEGVSSEVLRTGEAVLVQDERLDPRVVHFESVGPLEGALIVAPLPGRDHIRGLLTIERLGPDAHFSGDEFELIKLFASHAAIALNNAEAHHAVEMRAETDPLTRLKNHGALLQQLARAVQGGETFSLLMVDLDGFKAFNDELGHEAGNVMLKRLASALRKSCREADEVFRYGGDEFAVLLPGTSQDGAVRVAAKVGAAVRGTNPRRGPRVTCSIGVATFPLDGHDRASILQSADRACYAAKRGGRDRVITGSQASAQSRELNRSAPELLQPLPESLA